MAPPQITTCKRTLTSLEVQQIRDELKNDGSSSSHSSSPQKSKKSWLCRSLKKLSLSKLLRNDHRHQLNEEIKYLEQELKDLKASETQRGSLVLVDDNLQ